MLLDCCIFIEQRTYQCMHLHTNIASSWQIYEIRSLDVCGCYIS